MEPVFNGNVKHFDRKRGGNERISKRRNFLNQLTSEVIKTIIKKKEHCIAPNICKCFSRSKIYRDRQCKILIITKEKLIIYNN